MIVWFTGNSGAGKTTLAEAIRQRIARVILLDGDQLRATISTDCGYSPEDRIKHNLRVAGLAKLLSDQGHIVLVSVIAPFQALREQLTEICNPWWVHVVREQPDRPDYPYEPPDDAFRVINNWQNEADRGMIEAASRVIIERFGLEG